MKNSDRRQPQRMLATCCIPWTGSFELDEDVFRLSVQANLARGFEHLYVFGTAGEGHAVTTAQFARIARIFSEETTSATSRQLGVIAASVGQVRERVEIGLSLGFDSFQISLPSWGKLRDHEVDIFFDDICGFYPQATFLFYNVARGLRLLSAGELGTLSRRHANLVAVKWATRLDVEQIRSILADVPLLHHFLSDMPFAEAGLAGLPPSYLVTHGAASPHVAKELFQLVQSGDDPARLQIVLDEFRGHNAILRALPLADGRIDGTFDKLITKLTLPSFPLRLLPPWEGATDDHFDTYQKEVRAKLPHWIE